MMKRVAMISMLTATALAITSNPAAAKQQNHFASIFLDGKKIGNIHYTTIHDEEGHVEELRTKATLTFLGIRIFSFTQNLHEKWRKGKLQYLSGDTETNGEFDKITVERQAKYYEARINGKLLRLPINAFPMSFWHFAIGHQTLLFDFRKLELLKVAVSRDRNRITHHGKPILAYRFKFSGDLNATLWFDEAKKIVKAEYMESGRRVLVLIDP